MSQFLDSIQEVKKNYTKYDAWEQNQADDAARREYLSKALEMPKDKVELTEAKAKVVVRAAELLDKRSEDNCENMEQSIGIITLLAMLPFIFLPSLVMKSNIAQKMKTKLNIVQNFGMFAVIIGLTLWGNEKQKDASRVGRFQAKQHELKDVKNFVIYTSEQIEAAKILAKNIPDKKDEKGIAKMLNDMKQMSQDKEEYKKWLEQKVNNQEDIQKILDTEFTPEQMAQGEEDKEIIVNIVKDINIKAEEYSENTENAYDTMAVFTGLGGIGLGFVLQKIFKKIPPSVKGFLPAISGLVLGLGVLLSGTAEQKKAARVGRFVKTKEILENPKVLMAYTDEQLKQVENVKAPQQKKGFFEKITSNFKFLETYSKEKKEFEKYLKTEARENEKLYEALKQVDVSQKQLKDAEHLQEKTFNAFDKIDEMSQRYSEDIEAGTDIAKQLVGTIWGLVSSAAVLLVPLLALKGKLPVHKFAKWASNIALDQGSSLKKLLDKGYEIIAKDKTLKEDLSKAIFIKASREKLAQNAELKDILTKLEVEVKDIQKHFKQGRVATWFRNILTDISKLWAKSKLKSAQVKPSKEVMDKFTFNYDNYKTLWNSIIIAGIPVTGLLIGVPYAFNSWLTSIQKKAGKIGIMKAMEEIDNPKLYIDFDKEENEEQLKTSLLPAA